MVEDTQKRYADDITLQELVRLRVEIERLRERDGFIAVLDKQIVEKDAKIERLREALQRYACNCKGDCERYPCGGFAISALQQKETE